jgi:hypothetical protein
MSRQPVLNPDASKEAVGQLFVVVVCGVVGMLFTAYSLFTMTHGSWTWWALPLWIAAVQVSRVCRLNPVVDLVAWVLVYPPLAGLILACF